MRVVNGQFPSIEQITGQYAKPAVPGPSESKEDSFAAILSERKNARQSSDHSVSKLTEPEQTKVCSEVHDLQADRRKGNYSVSKLTESEQTKVCSEAHGLQANRREIRFSKHASERLTDRNIELSDGQLKRLTDGTHKAGEKGINDSLVIMD
ncbi:MAG: hypothetical protein IIZ75_11620, partial [Lachnospiraceae bacterium]|nr:hypothetical protein [Lachnospiraceae bacterium]